MAKKGLNPSNIGPILRDLSQKGGWVLCIGAGTSKPMFPDWYNLVERLVAKDVGEKNAHELVVKLLSQYSPDALIQAAHDRLRCTDEEFFEILSNELYNNFRSRISLQEWNFFADMLSARLGEYRRSNWISYLQLIRGHFPSLSALKISEILSETVGTESAPMAIISFNAEPLMASLTNAFLRINKLTAREARDGLGQRIDLITHSITNRNSQHIPYYFIHGLLPVPSIQKKRRRTDAVDKLVFSESEYLQLANTTFSWQSSVFLDLTSARSTLFIGVSLSDPNMRRWLSWTHLNRMKELGKRYSYSGSSTNHYWINRKPDTVAERLWIESSVEHLGVRLIWLSDWNQIDTALKSILGLPLSPA